ncbi:unnamed protein product [Ambrosiozyma monospora]|uniref:Unnamed protein product n=1 Tax=Ambrosiozyma monospora TaxID=43982 RepID=A0ACB5TZB0_AMBMO|nr:unnamed protein product [Ambrosiozyma monospora]
MPMLKLIKRVKDPVPTKTPVIPDDIIAKMNQMSEPERATAWMRCAYRANPEGEVTQISLWRSYEGEFSKFITSDSLKLLPAVDFIKNVQHAFPLSSAMVINLPNSTRKFIIKGIEPRSKYVDIEKGKVEALSPSSGSTETDFHPELKQSIQEPVKLFQYNFNDYLTLNEVNTSTSILINQLINYPKGKELFEGQRERFVDVLMKVPNLLPHIHDVINTLDY